MEAPPNFTEKPTILVVVDTPDNLSLMSGLLKDSYRVKAANSGERGLKIAMSDNPPDLILLDRQWRIRQGRGTHFDPDMVDAFLAIEGEFRAIAQRYADSADSLAEKARTD
jgi:response regulator RpfG family c-di-GMP phosphodiesterase